MNLTFPIQLICSPIGNLGDITYRAVEALRSADIIACEDTRHSRRLLSHYQIDSPTLVSLHEHNEKAQAPRISAEAGSGKKVCVLTDAGTPCISDPGFRLIQHCLAEGVEIEVLPGPSAITTALVGSGFPPDQFYYGGFIPPKSGKRGSILETALERQETSIYFESPHRIGKTIQCIFDIDPEAEICVARELTKKFETFHRGTAEQILEELQQRPFKGEITLLIKGTGKRKKTRGGTSKTSHP